MATLDTFFAKLSQSSKDVSQDETKTSVCYAVSSQAADADTRKRMTNSQQEEHQQKRSRLGSSNDRLKTKKKSRIIVDDSDCEANESARPCQNSDHDLLIKDIKLVSDVSDTSHRVLREISYEDFLLSNSVSCNRYADKQSHNYSNCESKVVSKKTDAVCHSVNEGPGLEEKIPQTNADLCSEDRKEEKVVVSPMKTDDIVCHSVDGCLGLEQMPHKNETKVADLCSEDKKDEEMIVSPVSAVVSKDIRSFFSKSTASISNQKDNKNSAILVKTKAQIHNDPSLQVSVALNKPVTNNCHSELARWQRANIVITNADLDIEVIEEGNFAEDSVQVNESIATVDCIAKTDEQRPEQAEASRSVITIEKKVSSVASNSEKSKLSVECNLSNKESKQLKKNCEIDDTVGSDRIGGTEKDRSRTREMKAKKTSVLKPKTDVGSEDCSLEKTTTNESVGELSIGKSENCNYQYSDLKEEILRLKQDQNEDINPSIDLTPSKEKKSVPELSCSPSKLADIFTPRSRRLAEKVQPDVSCEDPKSSQDSDVGPARRQSSRLCAKAAMNAIARSVEVSQKTSKVCEKKISSSTDDDSDVEVVDMETQREKAKSNKKGGTKVSDTKLAPIFQKRSAAKASKSPVLTAAQIEARRVRREFLISGIPDELKRQQEANLAFAFCPVDAALPTDNHVQQRVTCQESDLDPWNLPEAELVLRLNHGPGVNSTSTTCGNLLLEGLPSVADKIVWQQFEKHEELSAETRSLLVAEIKSHNRQFPVNRFYNQLAAKRNEVDPAGEISSGKKSGTAVVQKVGFKEDLDQNDASDSLLWTDKYAPRCATEIMGNWSSSKKLRDWLTQWKERIARAAEKSTDPKSSRRKKRATTITNSVNNDSDFSDYSIESYDSDINTDESYLCNAMVLYGPHGVGKTSMAYAIASELGFKIFEVNSSGQRDGKHVLTQLQEATQSHQVSRSTSLANSVDNERLSSAKAAEPENATTGKTSKKAKQQPEQMPPSRDRKSNTVERPFASIFAKVNCGQNNALNAKKKDQNKPEAANKAEVNLDKAWTSNSKDSKQKTAAEKTEMKRISSDDKAVTSADNVKTSLILFEEVDVVLSEDRGFWSAIETFMSITKRPIVLTASDPQFIDRFPGRVESIKLHTPQLVNTASFLQTVCLVEDVRTSYADLLSLVSLMHGDVRKALLLLQAWVQTGASGHHRMSVPVYAFADDQNVKVESNRPVEQNAASKLAVAVTAIEVGGRSGRPPIIADGASDEEFAEIRSNKRRRLRQRIDSSEEDSESVVAKPEELIVNVDDCSQESCNSRTACGFDAGAVHPPTVALSAELAPHVHRMSKEFIGGYSASHELMCGGEVYRHPAWVGDCWWPELSTFDTALQNVSFLQSTSHDSEPAVPSVRSMFAVYDYFSSVDCSFSNHCSTPSTGDSLLQPGNTDCLPSDDFRSASLKHQRDADEVQSALGELVRRGTAKWWPADCGSKWDDENWAGCSLRQEVCKYEKLALDVRLAGDFIQSRNIGLQRRALSVDYLPSLRTIVKSEDLRRATNSKRRFYHYMSSLFPDMKESVMNVLCSAFC